MSERRLQTRRASMPRVPPQRLQGVFTVGSLSGLSRCGGGIPFLHGSQGCATYIRRYLISHFREPVDIASSNFSESAAVFGGEQVFVTGMNNVARRYRPELIGVATTCLSETIGDDVPRLMARYHEEAAVGGPRVVSVSTPAYSGTHADGFQAAVLSLVEKLASEGAPLDQVNLLPGWFLPLICVISKKSSRISA